MTVQLYNLIIKNHEIMFQDVRRKLERLRGGEGGGRKNELQFLM